MNAPKDDLNTQNQGEIFDTNFIPLYQAIEWLSNKTGRQWSPRDLLGVFRFAAGKPRTNSPIRVTISNGLGMEIEKIIPYGLAWLGCDEIDQLLDCNQTVATYGYNNANVFYDTIDEDHGIGEVTQYETFLNPATITLTEVMISISALEDILDCRRCTWPITLKPYTAPPIKKTSSKTPIDDIRIPIILKTIKLLGGDPLNTSANSGVSGIKKMVRKELKTHPDFVSDKVFDSTWQAARNKGQIK